MTKDEKIAIAQKFDKVELEGSEKQKDYANNLRTRIAFEYFRMYEEYIRGDEGGETKDTKKAIEKLLMNPRAGWWIANKNCYMSDFTVQFEKSYESIINKK